ncbi:transcriptional repressor [Photobacterium sanctipauli]|uniref:Transcriptional repressor n=1 Tax=Photobacterium sanctipauli TaxID=1342794 RepID=A0A2T3NNF4_9GAMM|nr:Fur family transcriptional regulator [Photobacterium sanctipauli]PSW17218.1 transcriptional repressor [Photobacterium sanctipauli]
MNNLEAIICHAEELCRDRGTRLTTKRKTVLSGLIHSQKALSAYELIDICKQEFGTTIPATSVYRILEFLESEQLVHKLNISNKYVACSHITCSHEHGTPQFLICNCCNKVKEINVSKSAIGELQESAKQVGFQIMSPQIEMNCICKECTAEEQEYNS